jgi:hypothetical protein
MRNAYFVRAITLAAVVSMIVTSSATIARAADRDFSAIVDHISRQYHTKPQHGFLMSLAGLASKFAHPAGVKSLRIAVFEDLDTGGVYDAGLEAVLRDGLSADWRSVVRVHSRKDGSQTYIYTRAVGPDFELLVVSVERTEATVLKAKVDPETLAKWVDDHDVMGASWDHHEKDADDCKAPADME